MKFDSMDSNGESEFSKFHYLPKYDLKNELGLVNEYDKTAAEAQIAGTQRRDRTLVNMGRELGEMIRRIPYDHDRFFLVQALQKEIEVRLKETREMKPVIEQIDSDGVFGYSYEFKKFPDGRAEIIVDNWRAPVGSFSGGEKAGKALQLLDGAAHKSKLRMRHDSYRAGGTQTDYWSFTDDEGNIVIGHSEHLHEDGATAGEKYIYFFQNHEEANETWKDVRKVVESEK